MFVNSCKKKTEADYLHYFLQFSKEIKSTEHIFFFYFESTDTIDHNLYYNMLTGVNGGCAPARSTSLHTRRNLKDHTRPMWRTLFLCIARAGWGQVSVDLAGST